MQPEIRYFVEPEWDEISWFKRDNLFLSGNLDADLADSLKLSIDLHYARLDYSLPNNVYGTGL